MQTMTIYKNDHEGNPVIHYEGTVLERTETTIILEARFGFDAKKSYHHFKPNDRLVEWFFTDRWFNIFALHHFETNVLEGWYCNITRPAIITESAVYADDLALDLMVYPNGHSLVLDLEEFEGLPLDKVTRQAAKDGLAELQFMIDQRIEPFSKIK